MSTSNTVRRTRLIGLAVTTALASTTLTGCSLFKPDEAQLSANAPTEQGLATPPKQVRKAIDRQENQVLANPRDANARVALGATYLEAGRFHSADQILAEAMELGADGSDVVVTRALALVANGNFATAQQMLRDYQDMIDPADLGLAFALAGDPERGSRILSNALRSGQNTAKARQNFAYARALAGDWRSARLMVAEDVPADQVGARMQTWAATAHRGGHQARIASLLNVTPAVDGGRPQALALVNHPGIEQLASEASDQAPVNPLFADGDADVLAAADPMVAPSPVPLAPGEFDLADRTVAIRQDTDVADDGPVRVAIAASDMTVAAAPAARSPVGKLAVKPATMVSDKPAATARKAAVAKHADARLSNGVHMVQLGSFLKKEHAEKAWDVYVSRYPELANAKMALTEAEIDGTRYFRVAAADLAQNSANALCSTVKRSGHGCFAYAKATRLPGTLDRSVRMASART